MKLSKEFKVGSFASIIIIILYFSLQFLKGKSLFFFKQKEYYVIYDKGGTKVGDSILIKGIKIGNVTKTEFLKSNFKMKVTFIVDKDITITDKVKAVLNGPGLIPGRSSITLEYSDLDGIPLKVRSEIPGSINQAFTEEIMNSTLPLIDYVKSASALISEQAAKINSTIGNLEFLTYNFKNFIVKNRTLFDEITLNISKILTYFSDDKRGVGKLITNMGSSFQKINSLHIDDLNTSIEILKKLLSKSEKPGTTLGNIINRDDLYISLHEFIKNLNDLVVNVYKEPGRFLHFSVFGKKPVKR